MPLLAWLIYVCVCVCVLLSVCMCANPIYLTQYRQVHKGPSKGRSLAYESSDPKHHCVVGVVFYRNFCHRWPSEKDIVVLLLLEQAAKTILLVFQGIVVVDHNWVRSTDGHAPVLLLHLVVRDAYLGGR